MKLIGFWKLEKCLDDELNSIGFQWFSAHESPAVFIPVEEDSDYWRFFGVVFAFAKERWTLEVRLHEMPYRNKQEYLKWRKGKSICSSKRTDDVDETGRSSG